VFGAEDVKKNLDEFNFAAFRSCIIYALREVQIKYDFLENKLLSSRLIQDMECIDRCLE
jgi:hypothetical protein